MQKCSYYEVKLILSKEEIIRTCFKQWYIVDVINVNYEMLVISMHFLKHKYLDAPKSILMNYHFHLIILIKTN